MRAERDDRSDRYFAMDQEFRRLMNLKPWDYPSFDEREVPPSWGDRAQREAFERYLQLEAALAEDDTLRANLKTRPR
jgi:hypothetical protein